MGKWGGGNWGSWHLGPGANHICEPCQKWHSLQEAVELNAKETEYKRAVAWARNKTWLGIERREA